MGRGKTHCGRHQRQRRRLSAGPGKREEAKSGRAEGASPEAVGCAAGRAARADGSLRHLSLRSTDNKNPALISFKKEKNLGNGLGKDLS